MTSKFKYIKAIVDDSGVYILWRLREHRALCGCPAHGIHFSDIIKAARKIAGAADNDPVVVQIIRRW